MTSVFGSVGFDVGSTGQVAISGAGSTWSSAGGIAVGYAGTGTLAIANGGAASTGPGLAIIGYQPGSQGTATVD
ncbi:hypothetical protein, partial [Klebsiella pneumoniae]|uniref:hypothetical protein n=1 Tax=Klebsiella pneumoniae TaxID=573 RepID=UPI0034D602D3